MSDNAALKHWLEKRAPGWQRLADLSRNLKGRSKTSPEAARELASGYRQIARDLSMAHRVVPNSRISRSLEALYRNLHDVISQPPTAIIAALVQLYRHDVPLIIRHTLPYLFWVSGLFILTGLAGWMLVNSYPELASLFASEAMINTVQAGRLWTDDLLNVTPSSLLSLGILSNNISVSLFAFGVGIFFGLGTIYIIGLNGLMLGGIFAFTGHYDLDGRLFEFIIAHGITELSIICLAGALGMRLGEALVRPGDHSRSEALRIAAGQAGTLFAVIVPFLIGCGIIEGYISPDPNYPLYSRVVIGVCFFALFCLCLNGRLWQPGLGMREPLRLHQTREVVRDHQA